MLIPAVLFLVYCLVRSIILLLSSESVYTSQFSSDEPISDIEEDSLGYRPYVENLSNILLNQSFPKAFCVALVGPWGNGKSSVFELVEKVLRGNEASLRSNLFIHFLPYLNHNEDDIINEFFVLLSNQLSNYDGKVSNLLLKYSQKITDLYQSKSLIDFVGKPIHNPKSQAAKELYEDINASLVRINKKIVVFIDDLDRLSGDEIIQVLKLIRNTANFKNTIFVVAMDKDYVLQRLKTSNHILNSAYLEKFFQLEIYLPEIDNNILRESFYKSFENHLDTAGTHFPNAVKNALLHKDILFDDYIKNIRDVKRYSNQIKFDYPFIQNEIDLVDFINFTFLKTRFPSIVNQLYKDRSNLLFYDSQKDIYHIEDIEEVQEKKSKTFGLDEMFGELNSRIGTIQTKDLEEFKKYKIFNNFIKDRKCDDGSNKVDCEDLYLLLKTLYTLFGKKNVENSDSIQLSDNLNILFYRKIQAHNFTKKDSQELLAFETPKDLQGIVLELHSKKKLPQFLKKLQWFEPSDTKELKKIIQILLYLYQVKNDYGLNIIEIEHRLAIYVRDLLSKKHGEPKENSSWLWDKIFGDDYLTLENKIFLLGDLWDSKNENNLWLFSTEQIISKAIELYKIRLTEMPDFPWQVDQFQYYSFYHALKNIEGVQNSLNVLFINFWLHRDIELLCAQTIDIPAFSYSVYRISDVLVEIFGSKNEYYEFVKDHPSAERIEIKEYLEFLTLLRKTHFKIAIDFDFKKSELIKERIKLMVESYKRNTSYDELDRISQVIFETNDMEIFYKLREQEEFITKHHIQVFSNQDSVVARVNLNRKYAKTELLGVARFINIVGADTSGWEYESMSQTNLYNNESFMTHNTDKDKYIKMIHPKPVKF
ncbi:P-loop NTPase fold protein [Allomuricauda taeanensis]|uniref:KAP family P-loop NTPase fold protein n=1 Tax=Flagellimonas taeanensis TaxID=1005926 RepID=UPI002E7B40F9|nr:P-loop NTPase fold protein [Allomuricauda taeanensis]MEE1962055.1 P-loop NTPase fold protein [Allomuricauda taeanensis]